MEIWTSNNHPSAYHRKLKCNSVCSIFCCHLFVRWDSRVREMARQMLRISNENMSRLASPSGWEMGGFSDNAWVGKLVVPFRV